MNVASGTNCCGVWLYSGRSRNDQVATDLRLWLRDELRTLEQSLIEFLDIICHRAESDIDYIFPGYTHLQRGQVLQLPDCVYKTANGVKC